MAQLYNANTILEVFTNKKERIVEVPKTTKTYTQTYHTVKFTIVELAKAIVTGNWDSHDLSTFIPRLAKTMGATKVDTLTGSDSDASLALSQHLKRLGIGEDQDWSVAQLKKIFPPVSFDDKNAFYRLFYDPLTKVWCVAVSKRDDKGKMQTTTVRRFVGQDKWVGTILTNLHTSFGIELIKYLSDYENSQYDTKFIERANIHTQAITPFQYVPYIQLTLLLLSNDQGAVDWYKEEHGMGIHSLASCASNSNLYHLINVAAIPTLAWAQYKDQFLGNISAFVAYTDDRTNSNIRERSSGRIAMYTPSKLWLVMNTSVRIREPFVSNRTNTQFISPFIEGSFAIN